MSAQLIRSHNHATCILLLLLHFTGPGRSFHLASNEGIPEEVDVSVTWCKNKTECSYYADHIKFESGVLDISALNSVSLRPTILVKKEDSASRSYLTFPVQLVNNGADSAFPIVISKAVDQDCYEKSEVVEPLLDYFPSAVRNQCMIKTFDYRSDQFAVETNSLDLVSLSRQCLHDSYNIYVKGSYACNLSQSLNITPSNFVLELYLDPVSRQKNKRRKRAVKQKNLFFEQSLYVASITEDKEPGTTVTTLSAKDGIGSVVRYSMVAVLDARSQKLFSIDQTSGVVTTISKLDRESMETHYFRITATDDSQQSRTATTTLQINVEDVNDHTPQFEQSLYETSIRESATIGSNVLTVRATDQDAGQNAEIHYSILNPFGQNEAFRVDWKTGVITTRQALDREQIATYNVTVQAIDQGPVADRKSATTQVIINVIDENDNYPQFTERTYSVEVPENIGWSTNPTIAKIRASDADTGPNAAIRYSLIGGNTQGHFAIDSLTGDVSVVQPLDFESIRSYRLVVRAQDGGNPSRSNTTQLLINVKDINDHAPRFYSQVFQENVVENVPTGHSIVRVQAYDADDGMNAVVNYKLGESGVENLPFSVDAETGWVMTSRVLDREEGQHYEFQVIAVDGGQPPKSATATVIVHVQDQNDNDPVFEPHEYEAIIGEDAPPGTPVLSVTATDRDENPRLHYQLTGGNVRNRFSLTSQNGAGLLSVAQPLDYKQEKRFVLTITATDSGGRSDTATVYVNVSDANTYAPTFETTPYSANVFEDTPVGTTVLVVSATDGDVGENARITYSLSGDPVPEFTVNPNTGAIVTLKPLDREKTSAYLLTVTARDNGHPSLSDTTDVEITVTDVNDNAPVFGNSQYKGNIPEDAPVGASVLQVTASDADQGLNGRVKFSLAEGAAGGSGAFILDPTSGVLRTARPLDRETVPSYELVAYATDKGSPELSSSVLIHVTVDDINDSPPVFEGDKIKLFIEENSPIGSKVGDIVANDPDEGPNAVIQYAIIGGADADSFTLVPRSDEGKAELLTRIDLDYESAKKKYEIVIRAASPPLRTDVTVEINVVDVNDNAPILKNFKVIFNNYRNQFPSGPIGRVPVFDADVTDKLQFRILSGNKAELISLNSTTGMIMLSPSLQDTNVPITATMEVAVSDGLNEVRAEMQLSVLLVTDAMLYNSVTVRLAEMSKEAFLSPLLTYFTEGLAAILPCSKESIHIFSIQDDTDVTARVLNVSFSARKLDGDSFFSQQYLQEKIYLSRSTLAKLATVQVLPFDDTLCVREPCLNYEECVSVLKFGNASDFIASDTVLFRPIYPVNTFACRCPAGFTGMREHYACDVEVNLCYSSPCNNGGSCLMKEGGYSCHCKPGFVGKTCEIDTNKDVCKPDVCHSGAVCFPKENPPSGKCGSSIKGPECFPKGIQCKNCTAPPEWATETCDLRARSFSKGSFLTFPALRQRYRLHLKLSFATRQKNGLLLYNGRYNEMHDFVALEIINSYVRFSYSVGGNTSEVKVSIPGGVSDGAWHTVTLDYVNMTATLTVDDCNTDVAVKFGSKLGSIWQCANQSRQVLEARCVFLTEVCHRFLDLTAPLQIGGLPSVGNTFPVSTAAFEGCIRDFYIDHELVNLNSFVSDNGTVPGCPDKKALCASSPCKHGGRCKEGWNTYVCECPDGWGAKDCSEAIDPAKSLQGEGYITFVPGLRPIQFPYITSLSFRTRQPSGILIRVDAGSSAFTLQVLDGRIEYRINENASRIDSPPVNDGKWHNIEAKWMPGEVWISLDYGNHEVTTSIPSEFKFQGAYVSKISVGGLEQTHPEAINFIGFHGCLKDVRSGNTRNSFLRGGQESKVQDGCPSFDGCTKQSCPRTATCLDTWQGYTCKCQPGYVGVDCISVCELNPCENGATCLLDRTFPTGYKCVCPTDLYSGDHCEKIVQQTCPASWWGHPVCGPCDCDVSRGYNPSCNKTNGVCSCQDNRYQPEGVDYCLDCECYSVGSFGSRCDAVTGQCRCRPGVIGRMCDACPNPNAEVTLSGCEVIYDGCPKHFEAGVWWPRTPFGKEVLTECPSGSKGKATRVCQGEGLGWDHPDLFNCTSSPLLKSREMISKLNSGLIPMNAGTAQRLAGLLYTGLNSTQNLYGADILIAFETLLKILEHENKQQGLALSHRQDRNFIKNIIESASVILDPNFLKEWERIRELTSEGPELLLREIHSYSGLLARTQADTFTRPFLVVAPRIVFALDTISAENIYGTEVRPAITLRAEDPKAEPMVMVPEDAYPTPSEFKTGVGLPKFDNIVRNNHLWDQRSSILVPYGVLGTGGVKEDDKVFPTTYTSARPAVGYAMFLQLGLLLPSAYELNLRQRWGVDMVAEKNVFYARVHSPESSQGSAIVQNPVRYRIWIGETDMRSNPQCVHWKFEEERWSRENCATELWDFTDSSTEFVNCTCTTTEPVTVVMNRIEPLALVEPSTAENIVTYLGLVICLVLLGIAFLILSCLQGKATNTNSINKNIIGGLFTTQILFLVALKLRAPLVAEEFMCKMMAIGLQYSWLLVFTWITVSALHLYRMLTEIRDVNSGPMRCYYGLAYAVPAIVTVLTVGVRADQYGTVAFCWLSVYESAAWGLVGPSCVLMLVSLGLFAMGLRAASTVKDHIEDYGSLRSFLWLGLVLLPLSGCLWSLALLSASENHPALSYALSLMAVAVGIYVLFGYCLGNSRVRMSFRRTIASITGKKLPVDEATSPWAGNTAPRSALAYRNGDHFRSSRRHVGISTASTTSRSTVRTGSSPYRSDLGGLSESTVSNSLSDSTYKRKSRRRKKQDTSRSQTEPGSETDTKQYYDTETNSDEDRTMYLASSHSSDEDDTTASLKRNSNEKHLKKPDVAKFVPNIGGPLTVRPGIAENQLYASPVSPMYASHDVTGGSLYSARDTETLNSPMYSTPGMLTNRQQHIKPVYSGPWQSQLPPTVVPYPQGSPRWLSERLSTTTQSDNEHNMSHDSRHGLQVKPHILDTSLNRASPDVLNGSVKGSNANLNASHGSNFEINLESWKSRLQSAIESRMAEREMDNLRLDHSRSGLSSNEMTESSRSSSQEDETSPSSELNNLDEPQGIDPSEQQYV